MAIIDAQRVCKIVTVKDEALTILNDINLRLEEGNSLAIIGASGSGKSTLLALLAGLDSPSEGKISLDGHDITALTEEGRAKVRAHSVGFVFQSFQLLPGLTGLENVMLPMELAGATNARERSEELLARVGLDSRANHYPKQLSGGEQQRVAIARAFASEPKILFADEPTGNLDSATGAKIIDLLFELNREKNTTLVLVTHEQRLAERCERRVTLEAGEIVSDSDNGPSLALVGEKKVSD